MGCQNRRLDCRQACGEESFSGHVWSVAEGDQFTLLTESLCGPCFWFIKLALFTFYLRLFKVLRWLRYCVYLGILVTGVCYLATTILFPIFCAPRDGQDQMAYLAAIAAEKCIKARYTATALGCINIISDVYIFMLPLPPVWALKLPFRKRLGIAMMFSTGLM